MFELPFRSALAGLMAIGLAGAALAQDADLPVDTGPVPAEAAQPAPVETPDAVPPEEGTLDATDVEAWLDGYLPYALANGDIAGAVVTVVADGEIVVRRGYGYADLESGTPVDPDRTLFRPGSVSKLFTWTAVMQLVERGEVDLDADINTYLDFEVPAIDGPLTLRDALTHTPGFEEAIRDLIIDDPEQMPSLGDYLRNGVPTPIFPAGEVPAYSNYATALAGYVVERVSGMPFADYIDAHIFQALGMDSATFHQPLPERFVADMSSGYTTASDGEAQAYELIPAAPAGSLAATGSDMARFMIAHLDNGGALLEPATAEMMHTTADRKFPPLNAMLLGFYEQNRNGHRIIGHGGDTQYFHSDLHLFLDEGVGLFISMNSSGADGATGEIREELFHRFTDRYFPVETEELPTLDTAAEHGAQVTGFYENSRGSQTNFFAALGLVGQLELTMNADNELVVPLFTDTAGTPTRWREVEPYVWQRVDDTARLAVRMEDGRVTGWTFEPVSPIMVMMPVPWWKSSGLLMPLLGAALGALALTVLFWPVRAILRWRYGKRFDLEGTRALTHRLVRLGALGTVIQVVGWAVLLVTMMSDLSMMSGAADGWIVLLQIAAIIPLATLAVTVWNAVVVWTGASSWFAKVWSLVLPLALLVIIWFELVGNLIGFGLSY